MSTKAAKNKPLEHSAKGLDAELRVERVSSGLKTAIGCEPCYELCAARVFSSPHERREVQTRYFASSRESIYVVISELVHSCGPTIFRSTRPLRSITYVSGYIVVPYINGICFEVSR